MAPEVQSGHCRLDFPRQFCTLLASTQLYILLALEQVSCILIWLQAISLLGRPYRFTWFCAPDLRGGADVPNSHATGGSGKEAARTESLRWHPTSHNNPDGYFVSFLAIDLWHATRSHCENISWLRYVLQCRTHGFMVHDDGCNVAIGTRIRMLELASRSGQRRPAEMVARNVAKLKLGPHNSFNKEALVVTQACCKLHKFQDNLMPEG